ncbi:MAG: hypothetical protein Q7S23_04525 [bacterium]|nr:hypothetical protein [bacterium]
MRLYEYPQFQTLCAFDQRSELKPADVFAMDDSVMPCDPLAIRTYRFLPAGTTMKGLEYAAAHVLSFSRRAGRWVGASSDYVWEDGKRFLDGLPRAEEFLREVYRCRRRNYWLCCVLTLGIYWLLVKPPARFERMPPLDHTTWGQLFGADRARWSSSLLFLRLSGLIRLEQVGGKEVVYPTAKLAVVALAAQPAK